MKMFEERHLYYTNSLDTNVLNYASRSTVYSQSKSFSLLTN